MGILDRVKAKGGGGFLNNVDGVIVGYVLTTDTPWESDGKPNNKKFTDLFCTLTVRPDGAEGDETTTLAAGVLDGFTLSDDGLTLTPEGDDNSPWDSPFMRFYRSLVAGGLDDPDIAAGDPINFEHIVGQRVRFIQVKDEEVMANRAKWVAKNPKHASVKAGKYNELGQRKGKDGKFYDERSLEVSQVYGAAEVAPVKSASKKGVVKAAPLKATAKPTAKASKAADTEAEVASLAQSTLVDILSEAKDNQIQKTKLNLAVTKALVKNPLRDDVRKFLYDDANLTALIEDGVISVAKAGSDQMISLA